MASLESDYLEAIEEHSIKGIHTALAAGASATKLINDKYSFGGQPPIFHAVNSNLNYCRPMLELLVDAGADLDVRLQGLIWGKGSPWETLLLDVTPLSYAQCGLYKQFHRVEADIHSNLAYLYSKRNGTALPIRNVPDKYLAPR